VCFGPVFKFHYAAEKLINACDGLTAFLIRKAPCGIRELTLWK